MIEITAGKLLALGHQAEPGKPSLIQRFFASEKPVAKYFNNRGLDEKVNGDGRLVGQAYLAVLKRHGGKEKDGNWIVPPKNIPACNDELSKLMAKVLRYPGCCRVQADELTDFAATDAEMAMLEPFIVPPEKTKDEETADNAGELKEFLEQEAPQKPTKIK